MIINLTESFTDKEKEIYELLCENLSNEQIAEKIKLSQGGVRFHLCNIYKKLGVSAKNRSESFQSILEWIDVTCYFCLSWRDSTLIEVTTG